MRVFGAFDLAGYIQNVDILEIINFEIVEENPWVIVKFMPIHCSNKWAFFLTKEHRFILQVLPTPTSSLPVFIDNRVPGN